ncbi:MAG: precorrin-8X methylmutase [Streptosporangiales bacterium]|nr:precorrin-8X methylmutase [Streptosporangiales bacterium]
MAGEMDPVEARSYEILRSRVDLTALPPLGRAVTERIIHATADVVFASDLSRDEDALAVGAHALAAGAAIVADTEAVAAGITEATGRAVVCKIGEPLTERLARSAGISRSAAAVRLAHGEVGGGAVWVIGSAPSALEEIISRGVEPALVIGLPVGFVGAAEAKRALRDSGLPQLSNVSEKGGPAVAVAALTALLDPSP